MLYRFITKFFLVAIVFSSAIFPQTAMAIKEDLKSGPGLNIGEKIPVFNLKNEKGQLIKFKDHFKDKVLLLVISNYCNKDLAGVWTVHSYYKFSKYKDFGFPFIFSRRCVPFYVPDFFVSESAGWTADQVKIPYFLLDWDENVTAKFKGSLEDAHVYVVDRDGTIRWKQILKTPFVSSDEMHETLLKLLNQK